MAMIRNFFRTLYAWNRIGIDAIFARNLPWTYRWRMLLLQAGTYPTFLLKAVPYWFSTAYRTEWITVESGRVFKIIVFEPETRTKKLRPLHVTIHGGAWLGGMPEYNAELAERICKDTGAVVVSISYRYAPRHPFPAAIDDVDEIIQYLKKLAVSKYHADPELLTASGLSAGGALALSAAQHPDCHAPSPTSIKAIVTMYAPIETRIPPWEKPKPEGFPTSDPTVIFAPLFDSYPAPARPKHNHDPRMAPVIAPIELLPENLLMIIPMMDILLHEQTIFSNRIKEEASQDPKYADKRVEALFEEGQIHGGIELPTVTKNMADAKEKFFNVCTSFLNDIHKKYGYQVNDENV